MSYSVKVAQPRPPGPKSLLEEALLKIKSMESLEIIGKLLYNATVSPKEDKFRRIRLSNAKINSVIVQSPGCMEALQQMGWEFDVQDPDSLVISAGKFMTMAEVRKIEDSKERLKKEQTEEFKERLRKESQRPVAGAPSQVTAADPASSSVEVQA